MSERFTIWCNADLPKSAMAELVAGTLGHDLVIAGEKTSNLSGGTHDPQLSTADIAFGQPDPAQAMGEPKLKWVHLTSAGYTRYDTDEFRVALSSRSATLTNSSSVFDEPCAQHLLAFMLGFARQLPQSVIYQLGAKSWATGRLRPATRLLTNQKVLILGFGAIARRLVDLLAPFKLEVVAVRRHVSGFEPIVVHPIEELDAVLGQADHIVNILPGSSRTDQILDAGRFALVKRGAVLYNVGRGTTIDQSALIDALRNRQLSGAYLDVTDPEPLPSDNPLWSAPNCFITPHIAGGYADESLDVVRHFLANLRKFESGQPLEDTVVG